LLFFILCMFTCWDHIFHFIIYITFAFVAFNPSLLINMCVPMYIYQANMEVILPWNWTNKLELLMMRILLRSMHAYHMSFEILLLHYQKIDLHQQDIS
jgi:hypothetical protein